ncbi:hypothetical protein [Sinorhizobium meliloti]|uniref:hypothetical protein n=1 Tax=Rhizobium meliloti TaxID=382 RepID=UPI0012971A80|nr:hypothetical protein [Sinorhizobium meliloti]MQW44734.1 hypothetical protein [Sinorhizobium meliloti]
MEKFDQNDIYRRLGVIPIISCTSTRTTYGGSNPTQSVIDAMTAAARSFIDLDELAEAVGASYRGIDRRRMGNCDGQKHGSSGAGCGRLYCRR